MRLKARIRPENTMDTVEHSLMRIFRDGPAKREDAKEPESLGIIMKKLFSKQ